MSVTREELEGRVEDAERVVSKVRADLLAFDRKAENNVYSTLDEAEWQIEGILDNRASIACEGSHSCGDETYEQEFIVDGVIYVGTLECEYNRHDKTYYYLENTEFTVRKIDLTA